MPTFVDRTAPSAEWRVVHRIADAGYPTTERALRQSLTLPGASWSRFLYHVERGERDLAVSDVDLEPLAIALQDRVFPLIRRSYVTTAQAVTRNMGRHRVSKATARAVLAFDEVNPRVIEWAEQHAAQLVTRVTNETRNAIRELVVRAFEVGIPPRTLAQQVRTVVGLTERQAAAVQRYWSELDSAGVTSQTLEWRVHQLVSRMLRDRSMAIARTEIMSASNAGQIEAWRQGQREGFIGDRLVKEFIVTPDDRLCDICASLDGEQVPIDEQFSFGEDGPPVHVQCRCAVGLAVPE